MDFKGIFYLDKVVEEAPVTFKDKTSRKFSVYLSETNVIGQKDIIKAEAFENTLKFAKVLEAPQGTEFVCEIKVTGGYYTAKDETVKHMNRVNLVRVGLVTWEQKYNNTQANTTPAAPVAQIKAQTKGDDFFPTPIDDIGF
jgi:hypothetical protein